MNEQDAVLRQTLAHDELDREATGSAKCSTERDRFADCSSPPATTNKTPMNTNKELELGLDRAIELLAQARLDEWALRLEQIRQELAVDPREAASRLVRLYGGMGSINDLILYRYGQPLIAENQEFDRLRNRLYELGVGVQIGKAILGSQNIAGGDY